MLSGIQVVFERHFKNNIKIYLLLFVAFSFGISAGAFAVNGLSTMQNEELTNYFQSFLHLMDKQNVDSVELFKISLINNIKFVLILWVLGVTIIGIPFIYFVVGIRGFITGFSSGFIIKAGGLKGVLFTMLAIFPKEIIIVPSIIALGVSGINFSLTIIKSRTNRISERTGLKTSFAAYCFVTLVFSSMIFAGILLEAYIIPVFIKMITPVVTGGLSIQ